MLYDRRLNRAALVIGAGYRRDDPMNLFSLRYGDQTPPTPLSDLRQRPGQEPVNLDEYGGSENFYRFLAMYIQRKKYPATKIINDTHLMEMYFGNWENKKWKDLDHVELIGWMKDFVNKPVPGGESYVNLYERSIQSFKLISGNNMSCAVVTHSGVIRCILSYITGTTLNDSFALFSLNYGCIARISHVDKDFSFIVYQTFG